MSVFYVIDRSGSMHGLEDVVVNSFNEQLQAVRANKEVKATVSVTTFNHDVTFTRWANSIKDVRELTRADYVPHGNTALHDAIGQTLNRVLDLNAESDSNLVVIITDGQENSSRIWHSNSIKHLIESFKSKGNWTFSFIGANVDVEKVAMDMAIPLSNTIAYTSDIGGTTSMNHRLRDSMMMYAASASIGAPMAANFVSASETVLDLRNTNPDIDNVLQDINSKINRRAAEKEKQAATPTP